VPNDAPIVDITNGAIRGIVADGGYCFRGLPFAAPPTGDLRWRAPRPPADWHGVRDATRFGPSSPQPENPALTGPTSEGCLYLNVYTPTLGSGEGGLPVLVWIHGGRFTLGAGRDYDGTKLAALGIVVVTANHRLGALGFLAHPALAPRPGGPSGNYGLMDQQAALRWVQENIRAFGGDPDNVTISGQSSGGLSVLAHMVSRGSHGLFHRAIVQSGSFALAQQSLAAAEADGEAFAAKAGCPDQTADGLRRLPVADLVSSFPGAAIPGVVDGEVLEESIGTALAAGRFARVPSRPPATRRPVPRVGQHSAWTAPRCCRSCRRGRGSRRTSPAGTTARSGTSGNGNWDAGQRQLGPRASRCSAPRRLCDRAGVACAYRHRGPGVAERDKDEPTLKDVACLRALNALHVDAHRYGHGRRGRGDYLRCDRQKLAHVAGRDKAHVHHGCRGDAASAVPRRGDARDAVR
jgi:hypothetical protein